MCRRIGPGLAQRIHAVRILGPNCGRSSHRSQSPRCEHPTAAVHSASAACAPIRYQPASQLGEVASRLKRRRATKPEHPGCLGRAGGVWVSSHRAVALGRSSDMREVSRLGSRRKDAGEASAGAALESSAAGGRVRDMPNMRRSRTPLWLDLGVTSAAVVALSEGVGIYTAPTRLLRRPALLVRLTGRAEPP
jgi:hypothetical protein